VPWSVFKLEKESKRKKILGIIAGVGALMSAYLGFCLFSYDIKATVSERHIYYFQDYPKDLKLFGGILYLAATILPSFISYFKPLKLLGTAILISYIITVIFYEGYVISVWCFFASVISIVVLWAIHHLNKQP
jgi:hypothetical protein